MRTNTNGNAADLPQESSGTAIELTPQLDNSIGEYMEFCRRVEIETCNVKNQERIAVTNEFREGLISNNLVTEEELALLFAKSAVLDLVAQGWKIKVCEPKLLVYPPTFENETNESTKDVIRNTHLIGRDIQLKEKSVQDFIKGMERRRLTLRGWHSIYSLMRDGVDLAESLQPITQMTNGSEKIEALSKIISPYLQFVEPDAMCGHTGLRLGDVWRYFRHTWVNEYKSTPGRSTMILIRDAAVPNHPVIGIAALGSSVVQHKVRDKWIGWHPETLVDEIVENPNLQVAKWLLTSVERLIEDIYSEDLIGEKIFTANDIKKPTEDIIKRLFEESDYAIKEHRKEPQRTKHNGQKNGTIPPDFWEKESKTSLYRSKRCKQLAKLFNIRRSFQESGFLQSNQKDLQSIFQTGKVKASITQLVRMIKAERVGVDMLDITVCGAIAPYNSLLGGKLVCMLLCSPEVTQYYAKRYANQTSIIASGIKGKPVVRKPNLVLLCTTSLYGVGSSQYNRVKIPLNQIGIDSEESIVYKDLGHSYGFGTYHFSRSTVQLGSNLNSRKKDGRHVNSIFGEGVNPLMRKIRESLDFVGLNSDGLLQHGNKRVTYGIQLATNFREVLLGIESKPNYLSPQRDSKLQTEKIAKYWIKRWLNQRIQSPEILKAVGRHKLSYPVEHGAVVPIPDCLTETSNQDTLFNL